MKTARIPVLGALAAILLWLPPSAAAQHSDIPESTIRGGGQTVSGVGHQAGSQTQQTASSTTSRGAPRVGDYFNIWDYFDRCDFSDIGAKSLWKFPSETWPDGAAMIPPDGACKAEEIKDAEGNSYEPAQYQLLYNKVAAARMCKDYFCQLHLEFEEFKYGEWCVWKVHQTVFEKGFGKEQTFMVNLLLEDGRMIIWQLKKPTARNGYKWHDLEYETPPMCLKPKG